VKNILRLSNLLRCAKGAVEMSKTFGRFKEGKGKRLREETDAVASHSGTYSQRQVINVPCLVFEFSVN